MFSRRELLKTGLAVGSLSLQRDLFAQANWPTHSIRIVAPTQPGGGVDLVGRTIGEQLSRALGQAVVVDNQSGGGGVVAGQITTHANPDGYTLMVGYVATHGTSPAVRHDLPYDVIKDFTPIAMVGGTPNVLVVNIDLPIKTVPEFIAYAKQHPGTFSYGSPGIGSLPHLLMEQLKATTGIPGEHAPYRGVGPAFIDLFGGQIQCIFAGLAAALPHIHSGKLRALAVTGAQRHPAAPDLPTFEELGYKNFTGVQWYGIVGPAKLPPAITNRLNEEINKSITSPEVRARFASEALQTMPMSPEEFGRYIRADIARWTKLANEQHIKVE